MEEVEFEYRVEEDEKEIVEDVVKRRFKVGDLVEFGKWRWLGGIEQIVATLHG